MTGLDLAIVWGLLNSLLNLIPVIGNIISIIPPTLYAFVCRRAAGSAALP